MVVSKPASVVSAVLLSNDVVPSSAVFCALLNALSVLTVFITALTASSSSCVAAFVESSNELSFNFSVSSSAFEDSVSLAVFKESDVGSLVTVPSSAVFSS
mgnify:FL=1